LNAPGGGSILDKPIREELVQEAHCHHPAVLFLSETVVQMVASILVVVADSQLPDHPPEEQASCHYSLSVERNWNSVRLESPLLKQTVVRTPYLLAKTLCRTCTTPAWT
jgi:hypothetical protein